MTKFNNTRVVDLELQHVLNMTVKQRLHLSACLIVDKRIEDEKNGSPLYKRIVAEEKKALKKKLNRMKKTTNNKSCVTISAYSIRKLNT